MANRAFVNDQNIIEVILDGDQTAETIAESVHLAKGCADILRRQGRPIDMLFDFGTVGKTSIAARKRSVVAMGEIPYHKMAGINASPLVAFITNTVAAVTGNSNRSRHFKDRASALRWLREP